MEITAGTALGLKLGELPEGHGVRPTSVRARRAFFDSIGSMEGKTFADLFAGSGCMGLEAASRGAAEVIFAEESPEALALIRHNIARFEHTKSPARLQVVPGTLPASLKVRILPPRPDIVFADPPYALEGLDTLPDRILSRGLVLPGGYLILEHPAEYNFAAHPSFVKEKKYGNVHFSYFRPKPEEES